MSLRSFLLHVGTSSEDLSECCNQLFPYADTNARWDSKLASLYVNGSEPLQPHHKSKNFFFFLINGAIEANKINKIESVQFWPNSWTGWMHQGVAIAFSKGQVHLSNGPLASTPVYYCRNEEDIIFSSEIKALFRQNLVQVERPEFSHFLKKPFFKEAGSTPVPGIFKLKPNTVLTIELKTKSISITNLLRPPPTIHESINGSVHELYSNLEKRIQERLTKGTLGIPLSGGCDSGAVAGIVAKHQSDIHTFTMGTAAHNEFKEAQQMSHFIGAQHHEVLIPEEELIPAILEGIYLNELCDPEYAIGYAGLYFTYKAASGVVDQMITGYGADLTLSNFLNVPDGEIEATAKKLLNRTSQTGELSPYVPLLFGLEIDHPFLDHEITSHIVSMPLEYKVRKEVNETIDKFIEKEMIAKFQLMPEDLIHRPKKALHTGAGIGDLFLKMADFKTQQPEKFKSAFLFEAWKQLIFEGRKPGDCDPGEILYAAKKTLQ
ncbi:MAG: hypothetical protein GY751_23330 [Bacteroidetes bacterium]|nr:hypothetical protein [Bacteroidota bacterium]